MDFPIGWPVILAGKLFCKSRTFGFQAWETIMKICLQKYCALIISLSITHPRPPYHSCLTHSMDAPPTHLSPPSLYLSACPTPRISLRWLISLNLSRNYLTGKIIPEIGWMKMLESLYMSANKLSVPRRRNKCEYCARQRQKNIQEEDGFITFGFYVSMGLGFILGFWTVLGTMLLNSPSRHAYFKFLGHIKNWLCVTTALNMARLQRRLYR